jgi:glycosyltransferase involved in cell wall biosynthesis
MPHGHEDVYMMPIIEPKEGSVAPPTGNGDRKRVLVCIGRYLPGSKDGGPIRSIANMVTHLSPYFDFYIVTADRDVKDAATYPGITSGRWYRVGSAWVLYCSSVGTAIIRRAFRQIRPDLVVLNSFLDKFTQIALLLRRSGAFGKTPTLLAPRGEFSAGAMEIKQRKKDLYRKVAKMLGLYHHLLWQVSTAREKQELLEAAPACRLDPGSVHVAYNITDDLATSALHVMKEAGAVKLVFISRISEKKNLHYLLEALPKIQGQVHLSVFGPVTEKDSPYWEKCKVSSAKLPNNIKVDYHGSLEHSAVPQSLHDHHFFTLPTRGENFCHAAVESFVNGTPVILSDTTPWSGLEELNAGFDISLQDREKWITTLQKCVDMDQGTYALYLEGAKEYGRRFSVREAVRQHLVMFNDALDSSL